MRTTDTPSAATVPDLEAYLRVHRLLRISASRFADVLTSLATSTTSTTPTASSTPTTPTTPTTASASAASRPTSRDRAIVRWYRGFAGEIRCHHHIEDALLFPALQARVATYGALGPRLDHDHAELDTLLDQLAVALSAGERPAAARLAGEIRDHLDEHLAFEDGEVAPLFVRHFTAIEFEELNAKAVKMTPPKQLTFTAPWLMSLLDETEQAQLLASVPKAMTLLWIMTRGRYARTTARVFGDATTAGDR